MGIVDLSGINSDTNIVNAQKNAKKQGSTELGQDAFLQLMMCQLQQQDPLKPTDSTQFLAQQAQMTQVSETQKMNTNLTKLLENQSSSTQIMQASSLIGKEVTLLDPNDATGKTTITGKVTEAKFNSTGAGITVNGTDYGLATVTGVKG